MMTSPSAVIAAMNYEPLAEGYGRMQGYERFDGRASPTDARFWTIDIVAGEVEPEPFDVVEGQASGATAIVCAAPAIMSGSWVNGDAAGVMILTGIVCRRWRTLIGAL